MENIDIIAIEEVTKTTTQISNKIGIFVTQIVLFKSAIIMVYFYDSSNNGSIIRVETLNLEGDDYTAWGLDDNYIQSYVFTKLNIIPT